MLSLEDAPVVDITSLLSSKDPDVVVFAAGAGGKGDPSRTRKVDYEGAVKVYDALEASNIRRLIVVGALDVRNRDGEVPEWYNDEDSEPPDMSLEAAHALCRCIAHVCEADHTGKTSDRMWGAIPAYESRRLIHPVDPKPYLCTSIPPLALPRTPG